MMVPVVRGQAAGWCGVLYGMLLTVLAGLPNLPVQAQEPLIASISREIIRENRSGTGRTWFHPRVCMLPDESGHPVALMTLQEIGGSDYFGPVHWSLSRDLGRTWTDPQPIPALGREPVTGRSDGLEAGVCDVVPQYHPPTGTVIALGHVVFYKGPYFARDEQLPRYPVYAVRAADGTWSERRILQWNDPRSRECGIYTNNCGQRVVCPDGSVQLAFSFGQPQTPRRVCGVRAAFDGRFLTVREAGPALTSTAGRGLLEPSITWFDERFWMTLRAEDGRGYLSVSRDGIHWRKQIPWTWDDGTPLDMSTTQQHWLEHSDGLFLVYTRQDASNENVIRWRSPLWVARVDPERLCLQRTTERIVLPLVGDGIRDPDQVALMGNFHVTTVSSRESWVTVGEWIPKQQARGNLLLARIRWSVPSRRPLW